MSRAGKQCRQYLKSSLVCSLAPPRRARSPCYLVRYRRISAGCAECRWWTMRTKFVVRIGPRSLLCWTLGAGLSGSAGPYSNKTTFSASSYEHTRPINGYPCYLDPLVSRVERITTQTINNASRYLTRIDIAMPRTCWEKVPSSSKPVGSHKSNIDHQQDASWSTHVMVNIPSLCLLVSLSVSSLSSCPPTRYHRSDRVPDTMMQ